MGPRPLPAPDGRLIGIVVALPGEQRALRAGFRRHDEHAHLRLGGIGERVADATQALLAAGVGALVSIGVAGSLDQQLAPGTVVLPARVHTDTHEEARVDANWRAEMCRVLHGHVTLAEGDLVSTTVPALSTSAKARLQRAHHAQIIDMEAATVARIALQAGCPFLAIKAVADDATTTVPRALYNALTADGGVDTKALAMALLFNARTLATAVRLAVQYRRALASLTVVARRAGPQLGLNGLGPPAPR